MQPGELTPSSVFPRGNSWGAELEMAIFGNAALLPVAEPTSLEFQYDNGCVAHHSWPEAGRPLRTESLRRNMTEWAPRANVQLELGIVAPTL